MIEVLAPATSANLGPCFDSAGVALNLYNKHIIKETSSIFIVNGEKISPLSTDNLIVKSIFEAFEIAKYSPKGFDLKVESSIPSARGLGSSSSCICAGLSLGFALANYKISRDELFNISAKIEGHPDNVAPCIFGGIVTAIKDEMGVYHKSEIRLNKKYSFCAFIPSFKLSTSKSRMVLPQTYERSDVVFNISRALSLSMALQKGDSKLLSMALEDKIHQPYRKSLIENYDEITALAKENSFAGVYLSGAGPTIMAIADEKTNILKMQKDLSSFPSWEMKRLNIDTKGIKVKKY